MKKLIVAWLLSLMLILTPTPAHADQGCIVTVAGTKVCGEILGQPLPQITVTVTPDPITSLIPGPTKTVTATPQPQPGPTVFVPGPTQTVFVEVPQSPGTVTVTETETETVTRTPRAVPTPTATQSPSGQISSPDATVSPDPKDEDNSVLPEVVPKAVGYGTLAIIGFASIVFLGMWIGYVIGYKDSERKERNFLDALRDQFYTGKHRA